MSKNNKDNIVNFPTNLSEGEKAWHFHTTNPGPDLSSELNPHFDSIEGLKEEPVYSRSPNGLDCVLIQSCGPFDLPVGKEVPFSFCIIYGQTEADLINNARFAQVMYNSNYQGFTAPSKPVACAGHWERRTAPAAVLPQPCRAGRVPGAQRPAVDRSSKTRD